MSENYLPPFLVPLGPESTPRQAVFNHPRFGSAHALWWNSTGCESPEAVFLFVPGNPGLLQFYTQFLSMLHVKHPRLAIFAHAHLGHTPNIPTHEYGLSAQVESAIEAVDAIRVTFGTTKIVLSGHSVGAWVALQVYTHYYRHCEPTALLGLESKTVGYLSTSASLPDFESHRGHSERTTIILAIQIALSLGNIMAFVSDSPSPALSCLSQLVFLSAFFAEVYQESLFFSRPVLQVAVLRSLLNSRTTIFACLSMAHEEMNTIREPDPVLLNEHRHRIYLYYAAEDDWVSIHQAKMTSLYLPDEATRIVENANVPHAFCLAHSAEVASQCSLWLNASAL